MKKLLLIATVFSCTAVLAQKKQNDPLKDASWLPGTTRTIEGVTIYRAEGENKPELVTNIGWQSAEQMIEKLKIESKEKNWAKEKAKVEFDRYENQAKGGVVELYLTRPSAEAANTSNFTVVITTKEEKEVQRKTLKSQPGKAVTGETFFKNQGFFWISDKQELPFEIYVEEGTGATKKVYKFEVKQ